VLIGTAMAAGRGVGELASEAAVSSSVAVARWRLQPQSRRQLLAGGIKELQLQAFSQNDASGDWPC